MARTLIPVDRESTGSSLPLLDPELGRIEEDEEDQESEADLRGPLTEAVTAVAERNRSRAVKEKESEADLDGALTKAVTAVAERNRSRPVKEKADYIYSQQCPRDQRLLADIDPESDDESDDDATVDTNKYCTSPSQQFDTKASSAAHPASRDNVTDGVPPMPDSMEVGSPVWKMKAKSCELPSVPCKKVPIDIPSMRKSLTDLRRTLAAPEREDRQIFRKSVSMDCLGTSSAESLPSQSLVQELARLSRRMESMERAFLMSPTEAMQSSDSSAKDRDVYSTDLCAQFVEVLERGRDARKREVAELEQRMANLEVQCSGDSCGSLSSLRLDVEQLLEAQTCDHSARLAQTAAAFSKALESERAERIKEMCDLRESLASKTLVSSTLSESTGGTLHQSPRPETVRMGVGAEVDVSLKATVESCKEGLSQHVAELHLQLSEDLMEKLRVKVNAATEVWEKRIEAVSELFAHQPDGHADVSPSQRSALRRSGELLQAGDQKAVSFERPVSKEFSTMSMQSVPTERTPMSMELQAGRRDSNKGHASAADIADEGITTVVQPHGRSILGASREALVKRAFSNKLAKAGSPVRGPFGPRLTT